MVDTITLEQLFSDLSQIVNLQLIEKPLERQRYSKDYFEYSPILQEELNSCCADIVVRPLSIEAVKEVAAACNKHRVPLTLRGNGTGNYGQSVPLKSGVVMIMTSINQIRDFNGTTGSVTVETGCLMGTLEKFLFDHGRQLRLLPSTWKTASIGGFIAGGSGGIGSVRWGFLRDPGNLLGLEIITTENSPKIIQLDEKSSESLNHAYGTNGIITALTLSTAPLVDWQEVIIGCKNFATGVELLKRYTCSSVEIFLCTLLENKIVEKLPGSFKQFPGSHYLLLLVAPDALKTIERLSIELDVNYRFLGSEKSRSGISLKELSWNHTTLHMRSFDPSWTYLQMLLPEPEINLINKINHIWGEDVYWHLECVRNQGSQRIAALPLIKWKGKENLNKMIEDFKEFGAVIFNPHVITVEDGGLGLIDGDQVEAKKNYDPKGILNPGKLKGWLNF